MALTAARLPGRSETFDALALSLVARFAGEPQPQEVIQRILEEAALSTADKDLNHKGTKDTKTTKEKK